MKPGGCIELAGRDVGVVVPVEGFDGKFRLRPTNVFCLGENFRAHAEEVGAEVPRRPIVFVKSPSNLIGHEDPIVLPRARVATRVDHEVELGVVLRKCGRNVAAEDAWEHVLGFTVVNDVTARDVQGVAKARGEPWFLSKNLAGSCPVGPRVVLREDLPPSELEDLRLELRVNGEVRQRGRVGDMIFPVPRVISFISSWMPVEAGDLIAMGTPAGIGPLKAGDVVEAEVQRVGVLRNPVVKAPRGGTSP
ncbi:MAG: fumarylacetoacetate hydrolase family protein [Promethearchaeota archaeon]